MKLSFFPFTYILGAGSSSRLDEILDTLSIEGKGIAIVDQFFERHQFYVQSRRDIDIVYVNTDIEPHTDYIDQVFIDKCKSCVNTDFIIGVGGGSAMDIAKVISILATNGGKSIDYQGWDLVEQKGLPKVAIPTLSGTGSEFTRTAVMTSPLKKLGVNSKFSLYDGVIMDSDLLKTVPKEQSFYTIMDCYVHNCESLLGRINDAMTIALAESSISILEKYFFSDDKDDSALMVASAFGGMAVANSSVGICHPLSYGLSKYLHIPHGLAICICFEQLEEYYPQVSSFKKIKEICGITLPKLESFGVELTEDLYDKMADATLLNDKPLRNAFGDEYESLFTKEVIKNLFKKM